MKHILVLGHAHTTKMSSSYVLYVIIKDHKTVPPGELPATRPVVSGCDGMDVHFGNIVSEQLEAITEARESSIDVISTEDFLNKADEYNEMVEKVQEGGEAREKTEIEDENDSIDDEELLQKEKRYQQGGASKAPGPKLVLTGADAKCLYPSCQGLHTGRCVRRAALRSNMKVEGWNYREAARYVVMGYDRFEIREMGLERIVPIRRFKNGRTPGITGAEPLGMDIEDEVRWIFPEREATEKEKKHLFAACLEIGVRSAFKLHLYEFGGKVYHQHDGGPIGMRIAGAAAKIVMGEWSIRMLEILKNNELEVYLACCYVDDIRFLTTMIEKGWRWEKSEKKFKFMEEWRQDDEKESLDDEARHAREIKKSINSIYMNIQFETEMPNCPMTSQ